MDGIGVALSFAKVMSGVLLLALASFNGNIPQAIFGATLLIDERLRNMV